MKSKNKFHIVIVSGFIFTYILYKSYHYDNIFRHFFYLLFGGVGLYFYYNEFFDKLGNYIGFKSLKKNRLILYGSLIILANICIISYYEMKLNSPTLLKVEDGLYGDFKKNGDYIIRKGSWASQKHFYGKYSIKDNLIILDQTGFDDEIISNRFAIRNYKKEKNENSKQYIVQIDNQGNEIKNFLTYEIKPTREIYVSYKYGIVEDNRK